MNEQEQVLEVTRQDLLAGFGHFSIKMVRLYHLKEEVYQEGLKRAVVLFKDSDGQMRYLKDRNDHYQLTKIFKK